MAMRHAPSTIDENRRLLLSHLAQNIDDISYVARPHSVNPLRPSVYILHSRYMRSNHRVARDACVCYYVDAFYHGPTLENLYYVVV